MTNRIASLFALDELLAPAGNGHGRQRTPPHKKRHRRKHKHSGETPSATPVTTPVTPPPAPSGSATPVAKSFDSGAPIRCHHDVAYPAVQPVQVPETLAPRDNEPLAASLGMDIHVEAFDEPDDSSNDLRLPLTTDEDDDLPLESASDYEPYEPPAREYPTPSRSTRELETGSRTFAAEMAAVEQDLADLATRAQVPAKGDAAPPPAADDDELPPAPAVPAAPPQGHAIFDSMAAGMGYATEFRLPGVQLSQVFSALDRQLDAADQSRQEPVVTPTPNEDAGASSPTSTMPASGVLLQDLVALSPTGPATTDVSAAVRAASAIDVRHEVQLVPQQTGFSCWAAGAAMLVSWRDRISIDPSQIASATGYWAQYAAGLHPEDTQMFRVWRLTPETAQSYTVQGFADLLKRHGPLWVASAEPGPHVRVVTGMVGDGTPSGTIVHINDPWEQGMVAFRTPNQGAQYTETYQRFVEKQETLGRQEIALQGIYVAHN